MVNILKNNLSISILGIFIVFLIRDPILFSTIIKSVGGENSSIILLSLVSSIIISLLFIIKLFEKINE